MTAVVVIATLLSWSLHTSAFFPGGFELKTFRYSQDLTVPLPYSSSSTPYSQQSSCHILFATKKQSRSEESASSMSPPKASTEAIFDEDSGIEVESIVAKQYKKWEKEELELQKRLQDDQWGDVEEEDEDDFYQAKQKTKRRRSDDTRDLEAENSASASILPDYMFKLLAANDLEEVDGVLSPVDATPAEKLPVIAIIGRPNTGKSTIVNKLTNSYKGGAIVHDEPGITRDRTYRAGEWNGYNFQVVDTGGIIFDDKEDMFAERITEQALLALQEATVAVLICDGQEGLTEMDRIIADWLRRNNQKVPMFVAVNKCESEKMGIAQAQEFWELGLGNPYPVSGIHGTGVGDLLDQLTEKHMAKVTNVLKENATNIAFVGRPNVGKSSLFNRLYGGNRAIVSNVAGTTRDTVDALLTRAGGKQYRIVDTAGVRKKGKIEYGAEFFMVNRAFKAIRRADVVVLLLDATTGIVDQDRILAEKIAQEGRGCVIALNKWDLVPKKDDKTYIKAVENIRTTLPVLRWAEVVLISAETGQRTEKLFDAASRSASQFNRRISTSVLNEVVNDATMWMAPPTIGNRAGRIYYCIQIGAAPPTIVFFVNDPSLFTDNYQRYLERKIRDALSFEGTPIRMIWRGKSLRDVSRAAQRGSTGNARFMGGGAKAPTSR